MRSGTRRGRLPPRTTSQRTPASVLVSTWHCQPVRPRKRESRHASGALSVCINRMVPVHKVNSWLERQPLWRYSPIMFALGFLVLMLGSYPAAWLVERLAGGQITRGYLGFPDGLLSVSEALMMAASGAVGITAAHLWRKHRQARQRAEA
jgi:uncharacterized membrane protein (DUF485 family)